MRETLSKLRSKPVPPLAQATRPDRGELGQLKTCHDVLCCENARLVAELARLHARLAVAPGSQQPKTLEVGIATSASSAPGTAGGAGKKKCVVM